jgi:hypothetical protein
MEIVTVYNPRRRRVSVQRQPDTTPRRLVILAGWGMPDDELLRAVRPLLEEGEIAAVAQALGLHRPGPEAGEPPGENSGP